MSTEAGQLQNYDYDAAGNQTVRCLGTWDYVNRTCTGDYWTYLYDGKDQLRRASHFNSSNVLQGKEEYWYGANGNRTQTIKYDSSGNKTELVFWNGDTEAHYDSAGNVTHIYLYVTMGTAVARIDRTGNTLASLNIEYLFHGLGGGTLAAVDQATGNVNASFSYSPFGEVIEAVDGGGSQSLSTHKRRFNDKYVDDIDGLAYYGARYYDHLLIGWTQADPLYRFMPDAKWTAPRRGNLYEFSLNNPLRYVDPDGRDVTTRGVTHWQMASQGGAHYFAANLAVKRSAGDTFGAELAMLASADSAADKSDTAKTESVKTVDTRSFRQILADAYGVTIDKVQLADWLSNVVMPGTAAIVEHETGQKVDTSGYIADHPYIAATVLGMAVGGGFLAAALLPEVGAATTTIGAIAGPSATTLDSDDILFSQSSVNGVEKIATSMEANGWKGPPIDVVSMGDKLITADNTRLLAAHLTDTPVQAVIHAADEILPQTMAGRFVSEAGVEATTWGEAILTRIGNQSQCYQSANPLGSWVTGSQGTGQ